MLPTVQKLVILAAAAACCHAATWSWVYTTSIPKVDGHYQQNNSSSLNNSTRQELDEDCRSQIGVVQNGVENNTKREYDVEQILISLGGSPGKVNVTLKADETEDSANATQAAPALPLPPRGAYYGEVSQDTDDHSAWLYDYRASDYATYIRTEHAIKRFPGTAREHLDVQGELFWTPPDFCGYVRHATYRSNSTGFSAEVSLDYCQILSDHVWCGTVPYCTQNATHQICVG